MVNIMLANGNAWTNVETQYGMECTGYGATLPEYRNNTVEVPGKNGVLDLTDAFGVFYDNRTVYFSMKKICSAENFVTLFSTIANAWHGKKVKVKFDKDSNYFYRGRCKVEAKHVDNEIHGINFIIDAEPFKYPVSGQGSGVL